MRAHYNPLFCVQVTCYLYDKIVCEFGYSDVTLCRIFKNRFRNHQKCGILRV